MVMKLTRGEDLRDELLDVQKRIKKIPFGRLSQSLSEYTAHRALSENFKRNHPDYQCYREILRDTINMLVDELNEREQRYLGR